MLQLVGADPKSKSGSCGRLHRYLRKRDAVLLSRSGSKNELNDPIHTGEFLRWVLLKGRVRGSWRVFVYAVPSRRCVLADFYFGKLPSISTW